MSRPQFHFANRTGHLSVLALLTLALAGCQGMIQPVSQVRVIDVSPDAPALDIHEKASRPAPADPAGLYNIAFGTVSSYIPIAPGTYIHAAYTSGTGQQLATVRSSFLDGGQYTLLTGNIAADLQMTVLSDRSIPAPAGKVALRFLDEATRSGPVDIYLQPAGATLAGLTPLVSGAAFGRNTGYLEAPAGTYSVVVVPTATPLTTAPAAVGRQAVYPSGAARTILLVDSSPAQAHRDAASSHSLQIITANDFDPSDVT